MNSLTKRNLINKSKLSGEDYLASVLQEANVVGILSENDINNIQMQCIDLLAYKCEKYSCGDSSSIRVEAADSIMKSNLYTIGIYLKSFLDPDVAANKLKTVSILEMYQSGRKIIDTKLNTAKYIYRLVQNSKIENNNYTYNSTIGDKGIGSFFKDYNPDFEAHETMASIDYQLCNPVSDLTGVEYILKYTENIYYENQFCGLFDYLTVHYLLSGYDEDYENLLINIFEQVLTTALGCVMVGNDPFSLEISNENIAEISKIIKENPSHAIYKSFQRLIAVIKIKNDSLKDYIESSLQKVEVYLKSALDKNTLRSVFPQLKCPDLMPEITVLTGKKMDDNIYRSFIEELNSCRYFADKMKLIKQKIKSLEDLEDVLLDAEFNSFEIDSVIKILSDEEMAFIIKRHPINTADEQLSDSENNLRLSLKKYFDVQNEKRQKDILNMAKRIKD